MEQHVIHKDTIKTLGQLFASSIGIKQRELLHEIFGSRLSYTRSEPEHTAFLEGQKSVIQFINNAVLAATTEVEKE